MIENLVKVDLQERSCYFLVMEAQNCVEALNKVNKFLKKKQITSRCVLMAENQKMRPTYILLENGKVIENE